MPASKLPSFHFYPGDYLRDTQLLSERAQVAYDRIMCEHIRHTCVTHEQFNFFTKRLSEKEKQQLLSVLIPLPEGFQIQWVADSISKYKTYCESRAKNRKNKQHMLNISDTYVTHMEYENESTNTPLSLQGGTGGETEVHNPLKLPDNHRVRIGDVFSDLEPLEYLTTTYNKFFVELIMGKNITQQELTLFNDKARYIHYRDANHFKNAFRTFIIQTHGDRHKQVLTKSAANTSTPGIRSGNTKDFGGAKF